LKRGGREERERKREGRKKKKEKGLFESGAVWYMHYWGSQDKGFWFEASLGKNK
jgi:hypothetical protein